MKKTVMALVAATTIGLTSLGVPSQAEAHWRGGGWGPGLAGGLIGAAVIGGLASSAYGYGPGYGYYSGPGYGYYDGGYAPVTYGGYYGPRYRRVIRPAHAYYGGTRYYGGPRYHRVYRHGW